MPRPASVRSTRSSSTGFALVHASVARGPLQLTCVACADAFSVKKYKSRGARDERTPFHVRLRYGTEDRVESFLGSDGLLEQEHTSGIELELQEPVGTAGETGSGKGKGKGQGKAETTKELFEQLKAKKTDSGPDS